MCHLHTISKSKLDTALFITTEITLNTICIVCNYLIFYNIKWQFYYYQELLDFRRDEGDPQDVSTAVFYSISATQKVTAICTYVHTYEYIKAYCSLEIVCCYNIFVGNETHENLLHEKILT